MSKKLPVVVLDVGMPVRRSNLRHDLRLVCLLLRDDHGGRVTEASVAELCKSLNLRKGGWRRISEEARDIHGLWSDGILTHAGHSCATDGMVLDFEDGPHRIWLIQDEEPIGLQVLHVAGWGDLDIDRRTTGRPYHGTAFQSIRNSGRTFQSALDSSVHCQISPPRWWTEVAKREPHVQERPEYSSEITLKGELTESDSLVRFSISGTLSGVGRSPIACNDARWRPAGVGVQKAVVDRAVDILLSRLLLPGLSWDPTLRRVKTAPGHLDDASIENMTVNIPLGGLSMAGVGMWENIELHDAVVVPRDEQAAREWASRLYWLRHAPVHLTKPAFAHRFEAVLKNHGLREFISLKAINERAFSEALDDPALGSPPGARWLFSTAVDLSASLVQGGMY